MKKSIRFLCAAILLLRGAVVLVAAESKEPEQKTVWSSIDVQLYGYVKLDAAWDSDQAIPGNYVKWIELDPANPDDSQFSMTANETRIGFRFKGPEDEGASLETSGKFEVDFYGGGAENKPRPMLRHAYVDLSWKESGWSFLAGQTSDVISPLYPKTLNYPVQWWAGNIGYRRPQLRLTKTLSMSGSSELEAVGALTRDIGSTVSTFTGVDSGTDAGIPGVQGRLGWSLGGGAAGPIGVGLSGHWAKEDFHFNGEGDHEKFDSWSANLDLKVPLSETLTLQAEAFTGANLAQYLGGIGQGVNLERLEEIESAGGWVSLDVGPFASWSYHLGATLEKVDEDNLEPGGRSSNGSIFANGIYALNAQVQFGLEISGWETEYKESGATDNLRVHFAVYYRF